ncbi:MAG: alpha/beta fold hydrolase [Candidatus Nanopelagicaceae bacterium]
MQVLLISNSAYAAAETKIEKIINTGQNVAIDTTLYLPSKVPAPAVMIAHGFGGSKNSVTEQARELVAKGYVVLTWSARGFGKSTGLISMNSINGEVADSKALIDYLAKDSRVKNNTGDPVVGIMGSSYGGANALLTASQDSRIDAVIADITWNNLENALFPQSVIGSKEPGPFKKVWAGSFFTAASFQNAFLGECGSFEAKWCDSYKNAALYGLPNVAERKMLAEVSPVNYLNKIAAPTLITQGEADSLFPLSDSAATAAAIEEANPKLSLAMIWHAGGHDGGVDESKYLMAQYLKWFNKYLKRESIDFPRFQYTNTNGSISLQDSTVIPRTFESSKLPSETPFVALPLISPVTAMSYPIGGIPTAISSLPGIGSAGSLATRVVSGISGFSPAFLPGQSAFLESAPLSKPLTIVGNSKVKVRITSTTGDATLFFSLVVKSKSGAINQPNGIVAPVRLTNIPASGVDVEVRLPSVVLDAAVGDSIAVGISSTDQGYELPKTSRFYSVAVISPLQYQSVTGTSAKNSSALFVWPIAVFITLLIAIIFVRMRRPKRTLTTKADGALVEVSELSKVYKDGYKAVSELSFKVEGGQVVGLLGPNGAGKTTTLRMLMGLIFPTEGAIYLNGRAIYPGSPALANLGSFVEGPGFLPHLSGRENLDLYWKSIGRDGDNHLAEVVAITKLGTALDKKVRSYSQGMRQRLAIAQAMLGMPDLLVLDEPTNGLDPQQIAEMRQVLKDYAKTGRTVIISSHLLAEVQQTCSHVVLMHRGKLIAFGPMKKILTKNRKARTLEEIFLELIGDDLVIGKVQP